ncbi:PheA [Desulfamplus magnetovallimortis]|uniref:Bifunctional chorismate mutase/prephenate dehydratase n=1 Tax=Desulfamplus magnetovallimortis TaxID=1246637 RepID=A0A1W1H4R2_9BACT|nr:bifunctional chorismate mutase/prephenate dehydratase [Desulfamplus magnetovallimortis]SLM27473.1 PheA [Desulfamplus magnetovallimortis]
MEYILETKEKFNLDQLRCAIDEIDNNILELINKRLSLGKHIGDVKKEKGTKVLDRNREKEVLQRLCALNNGPATDDLVRYLFNVIMTATKEIQKAKIIAFPGPEAGDAHIAALNIFSHSGTFVLQPTIRDVFRGVDKKESRYGVVPVENSIEGAISNTLDLFSEFNLNIIAEYYDQISCDLLSITGNITDVKKIYALPQSIARCRGWLGNKMQGVDIIEIGTSAAAARIAVEDPSVAVIATGRSAHIYGLQEIESKIEDHMGNVTRFLVIGNEKMHPSGCDKTSIVFVTSHTPGALLMALEPVKKAGLNMVKLESRPTRHQNWSYYFFMDIEGHILDSRVSDALEGMKKHCLFLKHLGSYPAFYNEKNVHGG